VYFVDAGLKRCQQMFADLNRYAIRPTRSLLMDIELDTSEKQVDLAADGIQEHQQ
jgi:hypothetical protein